MPYCKNCHKEISRLDKDLCPYCGQENPIQGDYLTKDVTCHIDPVAGEYKLYKSKSHKLYAILAMALGLCGVHDFYLGYKGRGIAFLIASVSSIAGLGCLLFFTCLPSFWAFLLPAFAWILFDVILGLLLLKKDCLKDATGEYLR